MNINMNPPLPCLALPSEVAQVGDQFLLLHVRQIGRGVEDLLEGNRIQVEGIQFHVDIDEGVLYDLEVVVVILVVSMVIAMAVVAQSWFLLGVMWVVLVASHLRQNIPHEQAASVELVHPIDGRTHWAHREGSVQKLGVAVVALLRIGVDVSVAHIVMTVVVVVVVSTEMEIRPREFFFELVDRVFELSVLHPDVS